MSPRSASRAVAVVGAAVLALAMPVATASAEDDPRVGLTPGYIPWTSADLNVELLDNDPRVAPFDAPPGNFGFVNSDLAFTGDQRHRRQLQRLPGLRPVRPDRPGAARLVRLPGWPGRRVGVR